jgi:hypothetical protein
MYIGADIVFVHARNDCDLKPPLHRIADCAAGAPITAALERRTGDEEIRSVFGHSPDQLIDRFFLSLREIVVAAKRRRDDFAVLAEGLLKRSPGTDDSVSDLRTNIRFIFAADLGEKLIQVVNDANLFHLVPRIVKGQV